MNKTAKITILIIITFTVIISAVFFTRRPENFLRDLPYFEDLYKNTNLTINSRNGTFEVKIEGEDYGQTPVEVNNLAEGQYRIELDRVTDNENSFYEPQTFFIDLYRDTEAFVDLEIGPSDYKSGYILYYTPAPKSDSETGYLSVQSNASEAEIYIDNEYYSSLPIKVEEFAMGDYNLKIKEDGYEEVEVPIIIRDGFNLNVNTHLMPIPTDLKNNINVETGESE
jgi:hypothetical protein